MSRDLQTRSSHQLLVQKPLGTLPDRPRSFTQNIAHNFQRLWLWEILACIVAMTANLAMIIVLLQHQGTKVSSWKHPWTLNSIVSLINTVIKGAVLIPIAASIGQLKWKRFWRYQTLSDMEVFDEASRGAVGSVRLLWRLKFLHLASAGAILVIATLSIDPLSQNVVRIVQKSEPMGDPAYVPRANSYDTWTGRF